MLSLDIVTFDPKIKGLAEVTVNIRSERMSDWDKAQRTPATGTAPNSNAMPTSSSLAFSV